MNISMDELIAMASIDVKNIQQPSYLAEKILGITGVSEGEKSSLPPRPSPPTPPPTNAARPPFAR